MFLCETHPPTVSDNSQKGYGQVNVSCNVDSAEIYIDSLNTGKYTPYTFELEEGNYLFECKKVNCQTFSQTVFVYADSTIELSCELESFAQSRIILLEEFSNVSCTPCVAMNHLIDTLKKDFYPDHLAVIKYATDFPSAVDPFYLNNTADNDNRINYYQVLFTPTLIIDGLKYSAGSTQQKLIESINQRLQVHAQAIIELDVEMVNNKLHIAIDLIIENSLETEKKQLLMFTVITEEESLFEEPPGSNGETSFSYIMRRFVPDCEGISLAQTEYGQRVSYNYDIDIEQCWNKSKVCIIVFLQNAETKEVKQSAFCKIY